MAIVSDDAIVLGARPFSNTSLIVTFITRANGKVRLVAKGVRSAKSRIGVGLEPASGVHLEWSRRSGSDLGTMRKCETTRVCHRLWKDYDAMRTASRLLRILDAVLGIDEGEEAHFSLLRSALEILEEGGATQSMEGVFVLRLLDTMGLRPRLGYCEACEKTPGGEAARFDVATDELRCAHCPQPAGQAIRLRAGSVAAMREVLGLPLARCFSVRFASSLRAEILGCAEAFLAYHGGRSLPGRSRRASASR